MPRKIVKKNRQTRFGGAKQIRANELAAKTERKHRKKKKKKSPDFFSQSDMRVVQLWLISSGNAAYAEYFSDVVNAVSTEMQALRNTWLVLQEVQHRLLSNRFPRHQPTSIRPGIF